MTDQPSKTLQEIGDEFHMMIGECVTRWAAVEEELFRICRACLGCGLEQAAIVYYRTPTIATRIDLIDELLSLVLPQRELKGEHHPDTKEWNDIRTKITGKAGLLSTRNRLAHHPVTVNLRFSTSDNGVLQPLTRESSFAIYVSRQELTRAKSLKLKPLGVSELKSHLVATGLITDRLHVFSHQTLQKHIATSPRR